MRPIRAIPSSDEPSGRSGGTPGQTGRRSYGSAPPRCEACPRPVAHGRAWALASASRPAMPGPASGHCPKPPRPARVASREDQGTGPPTLPWAVAPPGRGARPQFASPHWHWLRLRRLPQAGRGRHRLRAAPSPIGRAPRGWAQSARPFFCRLLGALEQHLIPVDPLQGFIALGQVSPGNPKGLQFQPERKPALPGFVGRTARGPHAPANPRDQDIEQGMQTLAVVVGPTSVATPNPRRQNRGKKLPHLLRHLPGKVSQLPMLLPLCALDPVRITQEEGFVS